MTPTAHAAAKATEMEVAPTTVASTSRSILREARNMMAEADTTTAEADMATDTPMRASMEEAGKVMEAAPAAHTTVRVRVAPVLVDIVKRHGSFFIK